MIPFPDKRYDIIYADPPWDYEMSMSTNKDKTIWDASSNKIYSTMDNMEVSLLPVQEIANEDCLLFMWVVSPKLKDGIIAGESWGFKYITVAFIWEKQGNSLAGNYTMSQCELCLVFKRGRIPQPRGKRNIRQFLSCKRGRHSDKPDEVRHRITEMFPAQSKIELFARVNDRLFPPMEGWDYWGNEA